MCSNGETTKYGGEGGGGGGRGRGGRGRGRGVSSVTVCQTISYGEGMQQ